MSNQSMMLKLGVVAAVMVVAFPMMGHAQIACQKADPAVIAADDKEVTTYREELKAAKVAKDHAKIQELRNKLSDALAKKNHDACVEKPKHHKKDSKAG